MASQRWTTQDIPTQAGRTAIVTGSNTGLGLETARALAGSGASVVLAVRNLGKGEAARSSILADHADATVTIQQLDLGSLESIRTAAAELRSAHERIDLLINNAGVMYTEWQTTSDGFEFQMGVNHLGHFALTSLLLDRMIDVDGSRVVSLSSVGHRIRSSLDPETMMSGEKYDRVSAYGRSKLANLLFTYELQHRLDAAGASTSALAAHPGVSSTELARNSPGIIRFFEKATAPLLQSAAMGALPTLRAATDPKAVGGSYYGPGGFMEFRGHPEVVDSSKRSHDRDLQAGLWLRSEELTGEKFAALSHEG